MDLTQSVNQVAAHDKAQPDHSTIPTEPNAVLGVAEVAVLIGMSEKWVYETFSKMVPPRKTGVNGGGRSLWQRKRIDDWLEVSSKIQVRPPVRRRKPRKKVA